MGHPAHEECVHSPVKTERTRIMTLSETVSAIRLLKNGRDLDQQSNVSAEGQIDAEKPITGARHALFIAARITGRVPTE